MQYNNPFKSTSFHHTFDFGKNLSNSIEYGSVILLRGDLGSGKTTFCKGFASGLGFKDEILSPTYSILNEYEISGKNLYHFDLYRLKSINEFMEIGGLEYLDSQTSISLIEWPELIKIKPHIANHSHATTGFKLTLKESNLTFKQDSNNSNLYWVYRITRKSFNDFD